MPLLSDEDLARMRAEEPVECASCKAMVRKNYCRQCDEFFYAGHADECPQTDPDLVWGDDHKGHRTY